MPRQNLFHLLQITFLITLGLTACLSKPTDNREKKALPNILFIPVDDLRPELGAYGSEFVKTPNIDRLAEGGVTFTRAYCQQSVCNPSRASLLTGLRPDSIQVWDLKTSFRKNVPDVVTLPQFFKQRDYTCIGLGKTFHNNDPDTLSWTVIPENIDGFPFDPDAVYANQENLDIQEMNIQNLQAAGRSAVDQLGHWYVKANATENADVDDDFYYDGAQTTRAIELLQQLKSDNKPFFLSVGYYRPHLPFNAPKKYWDMYRRSDIPLADNQYVPEGSPAYLVHGEAELRSYSDCHDLPFPGDEPWSEDRQREIKHGYYASVSYIDAQIGRLIDELTRLELLDNTIIVIWGDHGWKLGEHNGWCKQSNYEIDTRVPLIISGAGVKAKGTKSNALSEFVDIYPTLCDMAGFQVPDYLQGTSLVPLLEDPEREWKTAAYSQFLLGRFGRTKTVDGEQMGYAIRTDRYRYVEWYRWNKEQKARGDFISRELFDYNSDLQENFNRANDPEYEKAVEQLSRQLRKGWRYSKPATGQFDWLLGKWQRSNESAGKETFEDWRKINNGEYSGLGFTMQDRDTIWQENMSLIHVNGNWDLSIKMPGESEAVTFRMSSYKLKEFVCTNEKHDFPKTIKYWKEADKLKALVSADELEIPFDFEKID